MLKIKESIDLKELEKFGFIFRANLFYKPSKKDRDLVDVLIHQESKIIDCSGILGHNEKLDTLYDLIKADMIEKIEE